MALGSAEKLLLFCAAPAAEPARLRPLARDPRLDWAAVYRIASRHGMVGILAPMVHPLLDSGLPETLQAPWLSQWRTLAMRDLSHRAALEEILREAYRRGLRPLLLKGFSVHLQAYPSEGTARGAVDVDLFISRRDLPAMARCLEELGFAFQGVDGHGRPAASCLDLLEEYPEAPFRREADGVCVDLHWGLCAYRMERSLELSLSSHLWDRIRSLPIGSVNATIPGREEEMLFLCLHLLGEGDFILRNLCDVARLAQAQPPVDWDLLCRLAEETGTEAVASYALELAEEAAPDAIPAAARTKLSGAAGPRWLLRPFLRLDRLLRTRGQSPADLATAWNGVLFAQHPWRWLPCQAARAGRWLLRRALPMLRWEPLYP